MLAVFSHRLALLSLLLLATCVDAAAEADPAPRQLLWGDTHLHTSLSFDAFLNGNHTADPDTAYRYAKGQPVVHPFHRARVQIDTPLDFLVVSDHAEFLGGIRDIYTDGIQDPDAGVLAQLVYWYSEMEIRDAIDSGEGPEYFRAQTPQAEDPVAAAAAWRETVGNVIPGADVSVARAWRHVTETADRHNVPGEFSALIGWEWTSNPGGVNLHRVVLTSASGDEARKFTPFRSTDSPYPEDLWTWMDDTAAQHGVDLIAIPHNSNLSKGYMFTDSTLRGEPYAADYARRRARLEPIVEITQIKGDSETHPALSPQDEFAEFESYPHYLQQNDEPYAANAGDFVRSALKLGLALERKLGSNPFEVGVIGSTDSHTALSSAEEPNFWGKMAQDSIPENKRSTALTGGAIGWSMSASGLAALWATENTREAIIEALRRREVYGTTGSRIRLRLFAGWDFSPSDLAAPDYAQRGYARGVPMGGILPLADEGQSPRFMIEAMRDPLSGGLDRVQMVKGWVDESGGRHEVIHDIAWSGDRQKDADGRLPAVSDAVDASTGRTDQSAGAAVLRTLWTDPDFDPTVPAFYYVRVLEVPVARHSTLDALALGLPAADDKPRVIQERAYSSAVWYYPSPAN